MVSHIIVFKLKLLLGLTRLSRELVNPEALPAQATRVCPISSLKSAFETRRTSVRLVSSLDFASNLGKRVSPIIQYHTIYSSSIAESYILNFLLQLTKSELPMNIDEYVPTPMPAINTNAILLIDSPPNK